MRTLLKHWVRGLGAQTFNSSYVGVWKGDKIEVLTKIGSRRLCRVTTGAGREILCLIPKRFLAQAIPWREMKAFCEGQRAADEAGGLT